MNLNTSSSDRAALVLTPIVDKSKGRAVAALIFATAFWGASFTLMRSFNFLRDHHFGTDAQTASSSLQLAGSGWLICMRFSLALLLFSVCFPSIVRRVTQQSLAVGAAIGLFFFLGLVCQIVGLSSIPASRSGFLTSLTVVFTPIVSALVSKETPRWTSIVGAFVAIFGVAILTGLFDVSFPKITLASDALSRWTRGDSLTVLGAVFFTGQLVLIDVFGKSSDSAAFTPGMFITTLSLGGLLFCFTYQSIPETSPGWLHLAISPQFLLLISVLATFPSLISFYWMNTYQPAVTATQASVIYTLEPLFATTWAMFLPAWLSISDQVVFPTEQFSRALAYGGVLILGANLLALFPALGKRTAELTDD